MQDRLVKARNMNDLDEEHFNNRTLIIKKIPNHYFKDEILSMTQ